MKSPYTPIPTNGAPSLFYKNITYFYQISYLYGDFIMVHFNCSQYSKKINGLFSFMQDILIFSRKKVEHIMVFGFSSHLDMTELIRENSVDNHKQISFMEQYILVICVLIGKGKNIIVRKIFKERVVDRLPLMTYGLKLSLEA